MPHHLAEKKWFKKLEFFVPNHFGTFFFGQKNSKFFISPTKVRHRKNALLLKWAIPTLKRPNTPTMNDEIHVKS